MARKSFSLEAGNKKETRTKRAARKGKTQGLSPVDAEMKELFDPKKPAEQPEVVKAAEKEVPIIEVEANQEGAIEAKEVVGPEEEIAAENKPKNAVELGIVAEDQDKKITELGKQLEDVRRAYVKKDVEAEKWKLSLKNILWKTARIGSFGQYDQEHEEAKRKYYETLKVYKDEIIKAGLIVDEKDVEIMVNFLDVRENLDRESARRDMQAANAGWDAKLVNGYLQMVDRYKRIGENDKSKIIRFSKKMLAGAAISLGAASGGGLAAGAIGASAATGAILGSIATKMFTSSVSAVGFKAMFEKWAQKSAEKQSEEDAKFIAKYSRTEGVGEIKAGLVSENLDLKIENIDKKMQERKQWERFRTLSAYMTALTISNLSQFFGRDIVRKISEHFDAGGHSLPVDVAPKKVHLDSNIALPEEISSQGNPGSDAPEMPADIQGLPDSDSVVATPQEIEMPHTDTSMDSGETVDAPMNLEESQNLNEHIIEDGISPEENADIDAQIAEQENGASPVASGTEMVPEVVPTGEEFVENADLEDNIKLDAIEKGGSVENSIKNYLESSPEVMNEYNEQFGKNFDAGQIAHQMVSDYADSHGFSIEKMNEVYPGQYVKMSSDGLGIEGIAETFESKSLSSIKEISMQNVGNWRQMKGLSFEEAKQQLDGKLLRSLNAVAKKYQENIGSEAEFKKSDKNIQRWLVRLAKAAVEKQNNFS